MPIASNILKICLLIITTVAYVWPSEVSAADEFPSFDNVTYTRLSETWRIGEIPFTKCRVNDPSKRHYQAMDCGYFVVNENPSDTNGRKITLFVGRLPAIGKKVQADPLVVIDGGPGGAPSESFIIPGRGFEKIRQQRDVYLIDQRGTGKSHRMDCPVADSMEAVDKSDIAELTQKCLDSLPGNPRMYTTSLAVADFDAVRVALGIAQWNLYGVSYGTRVAQHYLRRHEAATRAVILDGVVPPQLNLGPDIALESQRALEQLIERCNFSQDCADNFGDLQQGIDQLFHKLQHQALQIDIDDYATGQRREFVFSERHLMLIIRLSLYNPATMAILPLLLHEAYANQNFGPLARNAESMIAQLDNAMAMGMHNSVVCSEDFVNVNVAALDLNALDASYIGKEIIESFEEICKLWPTGPVDDDLKKPLATNTPVLLLSGSVDPITPPAYAEQAAALFKNNLHLVAEGFGHGISGLGCVPSLMADFINKASVQNLDSDCINIQTPDPFFIDFNGPTP